MSPVIVGGGERSLLAQPLPDHVFLFLLWSLTSCCLCSMPV